ncbi:MAG: DUF3078 domain-containing protein [Bacteroidota bacterium]
MTKALLLVLLFSLGWMSNICSQTQLPADTLESDSVRNDEKVIFTPQAAYEYINDLLERENLWRATRGDTLKHSLVKLAGHYKEPIDSVKRNLRAFPFNEIEVESTIVIDSDTLPVRWLSDWQFIIDTVPLPRDPFFTRKTIYITVADTLLPDTAQPIPLVEREINQTIADTISETLIDTLFLQSNNIQLYRIEEGEIEPPPIPDLRNRAIRFTDDSLGLISSEMRRVIAGDAESPFFIVPGYEMPDSLDAAVNALLDYTQQRDSVLLFINDNGGRQTPLWLSGRNADMHRFWVKNQAQDSISLWIGNPARNELSLALEDNVQLARREKFGAEDIPIANRQPQVALVKLNPLDEIPVFWIYGLGAAYTLNQSFFSNWARGGETSLSSNLDVKATANYTNKAKKLRWNNEGRLRYGTLWTEQHGFRTSNDNLEINSQFNTDLREKLDFSSTFYFKTQVAKGYKDQQDDEVISRFLNPGTFTLGVGVEYKPFKDTRLNFSPLSYRNTFVLDQRIDPTVHGIEEGKRSKQEMGGQLVASNKLQIMEGFLMTNSLRLFSSYLDKPQNVDVDWELNLEKQISWLFKITLNLHLIYDDDVRFPVLDAEGEPIILPDGTPVRAPRTQFKQFLGLTLSFQL